MKDFICLIWFFTSQPTIFQLCWDRSSWAEPVLSKDCERFYAYVIYSIAIIRWAGSFVSYLKFIENKMSGYQQYGKAI